jgi:hypothetical protein
MYDKERSLAIYDNVMSWGTFESSSSATYQHAEHHTSQCNPHAVPQIQYVPLFVKPNFTKTYYTGALPMYLITQTSTLLAQPVF